MNIYDRDGSILQRSKLRAKLDELTAFIVGMAIGVGFLVSAWAIVVMR